MICERCGRLENNSNVKFCPDCGTPFNKPVNNNLEENNSEKTVCIWDSNAPLIQSQVNGRTVQVSSQKSAGSVGFIEAVKLMFKNYANFKGRATRSEFWWGFLAIVIITLIINLLSNFIYPYLSILALGITLPDIALRVRRLHDTGRSGHFIWLTLIPLVGGIILLVFYAQKSDGDNRFGRAAGSEEVTQIENESLEEKIYRLSQEHEPKNVNTPDGRKMLDNALVRIIPTYSSSENLAKSIMLCNPQDIKANIDAMDKDTLLIIVKAFRQHINMGEDVNTIQMVMRAVNNRLGEML